MAGNEKNEPRAFTDDELRRFLLTKPFYWLAIVIAAFTGLRRNEIQQLVWGDVDLESKEPGIRRSLPVFTAMLPSLTNSGR